MTFLFTIVKWFGSLFRNYSLFCFGHRPFMQSFASIWYIYCYLVCTLFSVHVFFLSVFFLFVYRIFFFAHFCFIFGRLSKVFFFLNQMKWCKLRLYKNRTNKSFENIYNQNVREFESCFRWEEKKGSISSAKKEIAKWSRRNFPR